MKIKERWPSTATLRAEPARNRSLKISCERSPSIAGRLQRLHEGVDRQLALAREPAVVTAPGEVIHLQERRVGDLDEEDPVLRDRPHRREIGLAHEDVEGVEHEPDRRVIAAAHDLPGVAVVVDVAAPGERLEADAQAAFRRALAELAEIRGRAVDAAERIRRDVAAHEKEVAAELLHDVELALGAREHFRAVRLRHALEIAEGLKGDDLEPEVAGHPAHVGRGAVERE